MRLSQTELKILQQIAIGNKDIKIISEVIKKSNKQIYKSSQKLKNYDFLYLSNGILEPRKATHITLLLQILAKYPNLIQLFSGSGLLMLTALTQPKTAEQIIMETGLKKTVIYDKIKQGINISVVVQNRNQKYILNEKVWNDLKELFEEFKRHEETTDSRVPANSTIYYKNEKEILFSNKAELDAMPTGFSAYENYGIKLFLTTNYYYLPKKSLSKQNVFFHSLQITEKEKDIRHLTYIALFYVKFKKEFSKIRHPLIEKIKQILQGKTIKGYPTLEELKKKAEVYDIRL